MDEMAKLVEQGKIRAVGVSNFSAGQMRRAHARQKKHDLRLAANQMRYSPVHRNIVRDGALETAGELGVTVVAYTSNGKRDSGPVS